MANGCAPFFASAMPVQMENKFVGKWPVNAGGNELQIVNDGTNWHTIALRTSVPHFPRSAIFQQRDVIRATHTYTMETYLFILSFLIKKHVDERTIENES